LGWNRPRKGGTFPAMSRPNPNPGASHRAERAALVLLWAVVGGSMLGAQTAATTTIPHPADPRSALNPIAGEATPAEQGLRLYRKGDFAGAYAALDEAVALRRAAGETAGREWADLLLYRGDAARQAASPAVALAALREAVTASDAPGAAGGAGRVSVRNLLASIFLFRTFDRLDEAERVLAEAGQIAREQFGEESTPYASVLANVGKLHELRGEMEPAEAAMVRALAIVERTAGADARPTLIGLRTLAYHYMSRGLHHLAEPLSLRVYETERRLRPEHPALAAAAGELGWLFHTMGDEVRAEALLREALALRERMLPAEALDRAVSLAHLGVVLMSTDRSQEAVPLLRLCLAIRRGQLPEASAAVAGAFSLLGDALGETGWPDEALALLTRARELRAQVHGAESLEVVFVHLATARTLAATGRLAEARDEAATAWQKIQRLPHVPAADRVEAATLVATLAVLAGEPAAVGPALAAARSETERLYLSALAFTSESQRLALLRGFAPFDLAASAGHGREAALTVCRFKGIVLDSLLEDAAVAAAAVDPEVRTLVEWMRRAQAEARSSSDPTMFTAAEQAEKALARRVAAAGGRRRALGVELPELEAALPDSSVLVEFIRFRRLGAQLRSTPAYGAVVIAEGREPVWIDLGDEVALRPVVERLRLLGETTMALAWLEEGHRRLLQPVLAHLPSGTKRLYVGADGMLHAVPWAVLAGADGRLLAEELEVAGVGSGRDLLAGRRAARPAGDRLVVFAAPDFGDQASTGGALPITAWRNLQFTDLPGARREGLELQALAGRQGWQTELFTGSEATEQKLRAVSAPRYLHLATHGFVLPETGTEAVDMMERSGLALAGGRNTLAEWRAGRQPPAASDGILSAREAATLDLAGTELVTLSACETAAGETALGEGVIGLRRGFARAGARNLLLTLWPVHDEETAAFMHRFYGALLTGLSPEEALTRARRDMLLALTPERGRAGAVRVVGAFVLDVRH
jgi:CHAT domain-containing protein/tetratricopeptide (TPR) repeat protein